MDMLLHKKRYFIDYQRHVYPFQEAYTGSRDSPASTCICYGCDSCYRCHCYHCCYCCYCEREPYQIHVGTGATETGSGTTLP